MKSHRDIISLWPDYANLARDVGSDTGAIALWKHRDRIPAPYFYWVMKGAKKRGLAVTYDDLAKYIAA